MTILRKDKTTLVQHNTMSKNVILMGLSVLFLISVISVSFAEETKIIFVGDTLQQCVGVGPMECMMVKQSRDSEWQFFL